MHNTLPDFEMPSEDEVRHAVDAFRLLADGNRVRILWALLQGETSVNCLAELIDAKPAVVSQHLAKLRLAGLVTVRREGTFAFYAAADQHVGRLLAEALEHADHAEHDIADDAPHTHRRKRTVPSR